LISLRLFRDQPMALETARALLEDDEARLRQRAAQVLSALGDQEALPLLKAAQGRELDLDTEWALRDAVHSLESRKRKR
jgi:HEAT repeat protein